MNAIACHANNGRAVSPGAVTAAIGPLVRELAAPGERNFIMSNGKHRFVHAHTRRQVLERSLNTSIRRMSQVSLATAPLTDENRQTLSPGAIRVYQSDMATG